MKNQPVSRLRQDASTLLHMADTNLSDSPLKLDTQMICMNCKWSIIKYLEGYLLTHDIQPKPIKTISVLLEQCKNVGYDFEDFNLTKLNCRFEQINDDTCSDLNHLRECIEITKSIKEMTL